MQGYLPYILCVGLFSIGLYAIAVKKNLIKIIIGTVLMHHSTNLFLVLVGFRDPENGSPLAPVKPAPHEQISQAEFLAHSVDPVPQALMLTSIVIGLSITALIVVIAIRLHEKYGTYDLTKIRKLRG